MTAALPLDGPLPQPFTVGATWCRFRSPALLAAALLLAGYLRTAPGTSITNPWAYRTWAFRALAYSDVIALHADRGAVPHSLPYRVDRIEYPALLGIAAWLPSRVTSSPRAYFALSFGVIAVAALAVLWLLCALPGTNEWAFAASPALLVDAPLNWDVLAILPLIAGMALWAARRERTAAAVLALGACVKVLPALALPVLCAVAIRRGPRHAIVLLTIAAGVVVAVNLPFVVDPLARQNWAWFFEYSRIREIEPTLYLLLGAEPHRFTAAANVLSALTIGAAVFLVTLVEVRTRRVPVLRATVFLLCVTFLTSKVYSPQYWLWVVSAAALAGLPGSPATALGALALVDYAASFARLHLQLLRFGPAAWFDAHVFWPVVTLRYLALAAFAGWAAAEIVIATRSSRAPPFTPAAVPPTSVSPGA